MRSPLYPYIDSDKILFEIKCRKCGEVKYFCDGIKTVNPIGITITGEDVIDISCKCGNSGSQLDM